MLDIERFATPDNVVAYFGVLPIKMSSGIDRQGQPRCSRRYVMSKRGNDLVRRYLWMAALRGVASRGTCSTCGALHHLDVRAAAIYLVGTFGLEAAPAQRTEKRNG